MNLLENALESARNLIRHSVTTRRHKTHADEGPLAAGFREAMQIIDAQREAGVPFVERMKGLEDVLRGLWPQTREWKYLCLGCQDYGLVMSACVGDAACGRMKPHVSHEFGTPCWCSAGSRFRAKPKPTPEDFTGAGKSKPTRVGR